MSWVSKSKDVILIYFTGQLSMGWDSALCAFVLRSSSSRSCWSQRKRRNQWPIHRMGLHFLPERRMPHSDSCFIGAGHMVKPAIHGWWSTFSPRLEHCKPRGRSGHAPPSHKGQPVRTTPQCATLGVLVNSEWRSCLRSLLMVLGTFPGFREQYGMDLRFTLAQKNSIVGTL